MKTAATRDKALLLGLVTTLHEAHVLRHQVAVEVWRAEGVFANCPTCGEPNEVAGGHTRFSSRAGQDCETVFISTELTYIEGSG